MHVVTLSAPFGAGGAIVGTSVAEGLGVPFFDRAIPMRVASDLGVPVEDALARDEQVKGWLSRMLSAAAPLTGDYMLGYDAPRMALLPDSEFVECTKAAIRRTVGEQGGVILGRAGALVLSDHPRALHVRLDGDPARRARQAARLGGISESEAKASLKRDDETRANYVRHFYRTDPADPGHYHMVLDSTRISLPDCASLIVGAAKRITETGE